MHSSVYRPDEDTYLLEDALEKHRHSSARFIIEVGCGSGYISAALRRLYPLAYVMSTDVNPYAVEESQKLLSSSINGDVVRTCIVKGLACADIAVFNPPYLPSEEALSSKDWTDWAWAGGFLGVEVTLSFLKATAHIPIRYLVVCTLNPLLTIKELLFPTHKVTVISEKKIMSETLFVLYIQKRV